MCRFADSTKDGKNMGPLYIKKFNQDSESIVKQRWTKTCNAVSKQIGCVALAGLLLASLAACGQLTTPVDTPHRSTYTGSNRSSGRNAYRSAGPLL